MVQPEWIATVSARLKGKMNFTTVIPAVMFGLETVRLTGKQEADLEVVELKILWLTI